VGVARINPEMTLTHSKTAEKPLLGALRGQTATRPPFWFMRQAGRYLPEYRALRAKARDFVALCLTPELATEITLQPLRRYGMDAAILFADILLIPHAMGQRLEFREGEGPVLEPIRDVTGVARLDMSRLRERLAPVHETVRRVAAALQPDQTLIGFAGAPWTVAIYMVEGRGGTDFAEAKRWAWSDPDGFQQLIDRLVEATIDYLAAQIEAGAEAVQLFDTWAGALPADQFRRWCLAPVAAITRGLRARHPTVPVIAFPRGAGPLASGLADSTGVNAIGIDWTVDPTWAARTLQPRVAVQGNLDPRLLVIGGAPMLDATDAILAALGHGPFVFNLGHGIVPETPPEHVAALCEHLKAWQA
jgi:uroporphyrinogen decarboxylase